MTAAQSAVTTALIAVLVILSPVSASGPSSRSSLSDNFFSTLRTTMEEIQKVTSVVSTFSSSPLDGDLRLSSAISDCLDLLDLSSDEVSWTINSSGGRGSDTNSGTGDQHSDLRSWLSAAIGNQDTCKESLFSTGSLLASLASAGLDTITSLLAKGIRQLPSAAAPEGNGGGRRHLGGLPKWVSSAERRALQAVGVTPDVTVAKDGSGNYTTVADAVKAAPEKSTQRFVIYVKGGVYVENVEIKKKSWNLMIVGDGMNSTVISGSRNFVDGWTTFRSATFAVAGKGFIARDITFENTAGAAKHQAVALRADSDLSVFYRCDIRGYQDTLYAHSLCQFYRDCRISGTIDYMFGNAAAVFQNCLMLSRLALPDQKNTITAQGRKDPNQNTGFVLQFCNITADADLASANGTATPTYLGRPWKEYSRTAVMQSYMGSVIRAEGWLPWNGDFALGTLYYVEYMNFGPGSAIDGRVMWPGFHVINSSTQAANFTVAQFIDGNLWLPQTGVKYTAGLMM